MKNGVHDFVKENLLEARKARRFSVIDLSEKTGCSRAVIYDYESGTRIPSVDVLRRIANVLDFPFHFFTKDICVGFEESVQSPLFYRSLKPEAKAARFCAEVHYKWLTRLVSLLLKYIDIPDVDIPDFSIEDPTQVSFDEVEELALKTRKHWGLGVGPIPNMVQFLESKGVIISRYALQADELDAFSQWWNDRPYIILGDDKQNFFRSRFDAAHELAHLVMHRNLDHSLVRRQDRSFNLMEEQAHRFAGAFLFPAESFENESVVIDLNLFYGLKPRWRISIGAMIMRAKDLGFIPLEEATQIWKSYNRKGWKKCEPLDTEYPVELPSTIKKSIELILENNVLTSSEILYEVCLFHADVEKIAGLHRNSLNDKLAQVIEIKPQVKSNTSTTELLTPSKILHFPKS
jgi:Zn-dependent peptidase ImmA (M78 family)